MFPCVYARVCVCRACLPSSLQKNKVGSSMPIFSQLTGMMQVHASPLPPHGLPGTKHERTFICIKPDGVQRQLVGEVIRRFEARGLKVGFFFFLSLFVCCVLLFPLFALLLPDVFVIVSRARASLSTAF
jgi:Nucleoside diphosphate kinase